MQYKVSALQNGDTLKKNAEYVKIHNISKATAFKCYNIETRDRYRDRKRWICFSRKLSQEVTPNPLIQYDPT